MKQGVPATNVLLSLAYIAAFGVILYFLKRSCKSASSPSCKKAAQQITAVMIIKSWFKKYTMLSVYADVQPKYVLKQCFIIAIFSICCFDINHVILWPVGLMLPVLLLLLVLYEVVLLKLDEEESQQVSQPVIMNANREDIQIQAVAIEVNQNRNQQNKQISPSRKAQKGMAIGVCFIGAVLFLKSMSNLQNSVSNSGELNGQSVMIIAALDQLLIRPVLGLLLLGILKVMKEFEWIDFQSSTLIYSLCGQLLQAEEQIKKESQQAIVQIPHQVTSSPLKKLQQQQLPKGPLPLSPLPQAMVIDFNNLQPLRELQHSDDQKCQQLAYLTTPEKELFEFTVQQEESKATVVHTCLQDKENLERSVNISRGSMDIKGFEEFIFNADTLEVEANQRTGSQEIKRPAKARRQRRVLNLNGSSPYLQYLPNMLKKVEKYKHMVIERKEKKML